MNCRNAYPKVLARNVAGLLVILAVTFTTTRALALYQTGKRWPTSDIKVCWETGLDTRTGGGNPTQMASVPNFATYASWYRSAIEDSWGSVLRFTGWTECSSRTDTELSGWVAVHWGPQNATTVGWLSDSWTRMELKLPPDVSETTRLEFQGTVRHEMGHALGFQHELDRPDAPRSPVGGPPDCNYGANIPGTYLTPNDPSSIMNTSYCRAAKDGVLSNYDFMGVQKLYVGWKDLGGALSSGPTVSSWGRNRLDVFAQGQNNALWHRSWDGNSFRGWEDLGGKLTSAPACVSWGPNRIDCFARGNNNSLWHMMWDGSWKGWEDLGGVLLSAPSVASWGPNRLDVFAEGQNKALWHIHWDGNRFVGWEDLGGVLTSAPACVSWGGPNRIDCFARGGNNALWHVMWDGSWKGWEDLGGVLSSAPTVASWGLNRLDVFAEGQNNSLWHIPWNGSGWGSWWDLGGELTSSPGCVSWGPNRIDCFVRGQGNALLHIPYGKP